MLTFYYNPLSPNERRVWLALLEKGLAFEPAVLELNGDQVLGAYGELEAWGDRIMARPAWPQTALSPEARQQLQRRIQILAKRRLISASQTPLRPIVPTAIQGES